MRTDVGTLLATFPPGTRLKLGLYVAAQTVLALLDTVGVAAVLPLVQVLTGGSMQDGPIGVLHQIFGAPDRSSFVIYLAVVVVAAFTLKNVAALALQWWSSGLVALLQVRTSARLLRAFLAEPFLSHKARGGAPEINRTIVVAVGDAHTKVLGGLLLLIGDALSTLAIIVLVTYLIPIPSLVAAAYFGIAVFVLQRVLAHANRRVGVEAQQRSYTSGKALMEACLGFREIRMHNASPFFTRRYRDEATAAAMVGRKAGFLAALPKNLLEVTTIVGIVLVIMVIMATSSGVAATAPLALFVTAAIKLLPNMTRLTTTMGIIRSGEAGLRLAVETLSTFTREELASRPSAQAVTSKSDVGKLEVQNVSFTYPDDTVPVLRNVSLAVPPGTSFAVCGASGSGKTTLIDIILGLVAPDEGLVAYADTPISMLGPTWRNEIGYIPQDVYLVDDSIAANIAFGIPEAERDLKKMDECLRLAQLAPLISSVPGGLDYRVGERGNRLSGGQRQRVGIARALYRDPRVIILDEATSALDNETEAAITRTISALRGRVTTLTVAHRLSTVRHVDKLAFLSQGEVVASGTFDEVRAGNSEFARLVELGSLEPKDES